MFINLPAKIIRDSIGALNELARQTHERARATSDPALARLQRAQADGYAAEAEAIRAAMDEATRGDDNAG